MRFTAILSPATLLAVVALVGPAAAQRAARPLNAQQVATAIDRGVAYLKRTQSARGTWQDHQHYASGVTALCTLAKEPEVEPACGHACEAVHRGAPCIRLGSGHSGTHQAHDPEWRAR